MKKLVFIDYKDNIHARRFITLLSDFIEIEYFPISGFNKDKLQKIQLKIDNIDVIIIADYFRCSQKIKFADQSKIIISWAFDIQDYLTQYAKTNINIDLLIVDSKFSKNLWLTSGANIKQIMQHPFGVDQKLFFRDWAGKNSNKIISLRNWEEVHNQQILLETLEQHQNELNNFKFTFIGEGKTLLRLRKTYRQLEKNGLINFLGVVNNSDLIRFLPDYKLAISTSKSDGNSVSVLEAMSSGLPVLASNNSANRELIKHGKNGFLFENESPLDLYKNLNSVLNTQIDLDLISIAAKKFAKNYADWNKNGIEIIEKITKLLN